MLKIQVSCSLSHRNGEKFALLGHCSSQVGAWGPRHLKYFQAGVDSFPLGSTPGLTSVSRL